MTTKHLGKIANAELGIKDGRFGVWLEFKYDKCCGVMDFKGHFDSGPSQYAKWTFEEQTVLYGEIMRFICETLKKANRSDFSKMAGIPVELTFEGNVMQSWRVLEEVI